MDASKQASWGKVIEEPAAPVAMITGSARVGPVVSVPLVKAVNTSNQWGGGGENHQGARRCGPMGWLPSGFQVLVLSIFFFNGLYYCYLLGGCWNGRLSVDDAREILFHFLVWSYILTVAASAVLKHSTDTECIVLLSSWSQAMAVLAKAWVLPLVSVAYQKESETEYIYSVSVWYFLASRILALTQWGVLCFPLLCFIWKHWQWQPLPPWSTPQILSA